MFFISVPKSLERDDLNRPTDYYLVVSRDCLGRVCFIRKRVWKKAHPLLGSPGRWVKICGRYDEFGCPKDEEELRVNLDIQKDRENHGWKIELV